MISIYDNLSNLTKPVSVRIRTWCSNSMFNVPSWFCAVNGKFHISSCWSSGPVGFLLWDNICDMHQDVYKQPCIYIKYIK